MAEESRALHATVEAGAQLAIPGALVLVPTSDSGTPVADISAWQRAVLRSSLPRAAKLVALAIASHPRNLSADELLDPTQSAGAVVCSPGTATLSAESGYSRTHVQRQIRLLRHLGWLTALSRPAAGRPASFALGMPEQLRAAHGVAAAAPAPGDAAVPARTPAACTGEAAVHPDIPIPGRSRSGSVPLQRRGTSDRPSAAARRRSRITVAAMAKALTVAGELSVITGGLTSARASGRSAPSGTAGMLAAPAVAVPPVAASSADVRPGRRVAGSPSVARAAVAEAADQVMVTLARAMRRSPETLAAARDRLVQVLAGGTWNAAELAMHLVDTVGPGLGAGRVDDPGDHLRRRLDHLPASSAECLCRSCRSWVVTSTQSERRPPSIAAVTTKADPVTTTVIPGLAAIEHAAAAGMAQARTHPVRATGAA